MEYIHKAKAEKTRTKILSDQMEARRVKNKVCVIFANTPCSVAFSLVCSLPRPPVNVVQHASRRSDKLS